MPLTFYTLELAGTQKTFAEWGIELQSVTRERLVKRPSSFSFRQPVAHSRVAALCAEGDSVIVRRAVEKDETNTIVPDSGVIWFQGKMRRIRFSGSGQEASIDYTAFDAWYSLERIVFQQRSYQWDGTYVEETPEVPRHPANSFIESWTPHVIVPYKRGVSTWGQLTCEDQIEEVLNYAITQCGVELQIGTIEITPIEYAGGTITLREEKQLMCAQLINLMLDATPDAVTWIDYATTPPKIHMKRWAALEEKTIAISDKVLVSREIEPLHELQVSGVHLLFERVEEVNGQASVFRTEQKYPPAMSDFDEGALIETIDLVGVKWQIQKAAIIVAQLNPNSLAFWQAYGSASIFQDPRKRDFVISDVEVFPAGGVVGDPTLGLANFIVDGVLPDWIEDRITLEEITVRCRVGYNYWPLGFGVGTPIALTAAAARSTDTAQIISTNAPVGEQLYTNKQGTPAVDLEPTNLARFIYDGLGILHYAGAVTITEANISDRVGLGQRFNVSGGQAAWATMKAMVAQVTDRPFGPRTDVSFGPPEYIAARKIMQLLRENRVRTLNLSPNTQQTGNLGAEGSISAGRSGRPRTTSAFVGGGGGDAVWQ